MFVNLYVYVTAKLLFCGVVSCIKLRMNTILYCYVLPTLIEEEVVYHDITGHGHQCTNVNC